MPPQKTQILCPRCRQPILAQVEQLFDVSSEPGAKQRLLGGISNYATCQNCGFNGPLTTPIVYHDADKELLLTYFPGELKMPVNEQEKLVGPLFTQLTNRLPPEKRKAYLLRPQSFLTYQSLIERILGADGVTPEMIQKQQKCVALIERLIGAVTPESRSEIIKQEADLFDAEFFSIFGHLMEGTIASGQEQITGQMNTLQQQLLAETEYGRKLSNQANEMQEAIKTLQAAGKELDRDKLIDILTQAPNDDRLNALVSMTRPALDYPFFQSLSERIETKSGDERKKLEILRENLLNITRRIDQRLEEEYKRAGELLSNFLVSEDIEKAVLDHLGEIGDTFVQLLNRALKEADKNKDQVQLKKLTQIVTVLQKASAPPPELALLKELLETPDETALNKLLELHTAEISPEFGSIVASVLARTEGQAGESPKKEETEMIKKLEELYRAILKFTMKKSMS